jgi:hypothetical protein
MCAKILAIITITLMLIVVMMLNAGETFANKHEKATAIYEWFSRTKTPEYSKYKLDLDYKSNVVEYNDILKLFKNHNLTVQSIENII